MSDMFSCPCRSAAKVSLVSGEEEGERVVSVDGDGDALTARREVLLTAFIAAMVGDDGEEAAAFRGMRLLLSGELFLLATSLQSLWVMCSSVCIWSYSSRRIFSVVCSCSRTCAYNDTT